MALVLTLKLNERFFVDGAPVTVKKIEKDRVVLQTYDGLMHDITDRKMTQILPNVKVSRGELEESAVMARFVINAPREIKIFREDLLNGKG